MKIHIVGASCSGVTTLGQNLSESLGIPYLDTDAFFWENSEVPFTVRRNPEVRNRMLNEELNKGPSWIVGGSLVNWALELEFDLIIFLILPRETRLDRLKKRELEKYGNVIYEDRSRNQQFVEFINWASGYDDSTRGGRTLYAHRKWLENQRCYILELVGDLSVEERIQKVKIVIQEINGCNEIYHRYDRLT
jgi:adenylate kinase family enzyme